MLTDLCTYRCLLGDHLLNIHRSRRSDVPPADPGLSDSFVLTRVTQKATLDSAKTPGPVSSDMESIFSRDCEIAWYWTSLRVSITFSK